MTTKTWRAWKRPTLLVAAMIGGIAAIPTAGQDQDRHLEDAIHEQARRALTRALEEGRTADRPGAHLEALAKPARPDAKSMHFTCIPSCDVTDGRFLAIASDGLITLSDPVLELHLGVPAGAANFTLGVFDGDGSRPDGAGENRWDTGSQSNYVYTLFADPLADGVGMTLVDLDPVTPDAFELSTAFPNDAWKDFTIATDASAEAPSGNFFYRLRIELQNPATTAINLNAFKVRTDGVVTVEVFEQPFSYIATGLGSLPDAEIVFPDFPNPTPTTYDGTFTFAFERRPGDDDLVIFDGDFDLGKFDGDRTCTPQPSCLIAGEQDTDDPDTPNVGVPPFATSDAVPEGVAEGFNGTTGNPSDNLDPSTFLGSLAVREPSVRYELTFPNGATFANENPTGNQEWEQFRIADPSDPDPKDFTATEFPFGTYTLTIDGVDMLNLNALRFPGRVLCIDVLGAVCTSLRPFRLGTTVFYDIDASGVQDLDEPGIPGVVVHLIDTASGNLITSTTTDGAGNYSFEVDAATYTVAIAAENFDPGGTLEGFVNTTLEALTDTVIDDNLLDFDFGYLGTGSIGNTVWYDVDGDGVLDAGEPTLDGVTVTLEGDLDGDTVVDFTVSTVTSTGGLYEFIDLPPADYTVTVDAGTLPAGLTTPTFDADGVGTPNVAAVTLGPQEDNPDVDFGYAGNGSIGDRVWLDTNGNGLQDDGATGLNGVVLDLVAGSGVTLTTTTSGDGNYSFDRLPPDTYTVTVAAGTLPAGLVPTFDLDGLATAGVATVTLAAAETNPDVDFGYGECGPCEGKVSRLTLQYLGALPNALVTVVGKRGPSTDTLFSGLLAPGAAFEVVGTGSSIPGFSGTVGTEIRIFVAGLLHTVIHTSCSQPIGPGLVSGDFLVIAGASKLGGPLCPLEGDSVCLPALDFEKDGLGNALPAGRVIDDEYAALGVHVTTNDPVNHPAMIFDSAHPTGGDLDLGTPNQAFGGPGVGSGGASGAGKNAAALGNVLIVSEDGDSSDPDDNGAGGTIILTFDQPVFLTAVDVLDLDTDEQTGTARAFDATGVLIASAEMQPFGDNSFQRLPVVASGVRRLEVHFPSSAALAGVTYCTDERACLPRIDFEKDAQGHALATGQVIDDEFAAYGMQVFSDDMAMTPPMIFDSASPTGGDSDLGTPNQAFGGPGVGSGGGAGQPGENSTAQRKVLIVSEDADSSDPDDNGAGGTLHFTFASPVDVAAVDILDIDGQETMGLIEAFDDTGAVLASAMMQPFGNNSFQTVALGALGVSRLEVHFPASGAVAGITFCEGFGGCQPKTVRDDFNAASFGNDDGPDDWTGPWLEDDPEPGGAGPAAGQVRVTGDGLRLDDYPDTGGVPGASREVDLSEAVSATLRFDFATTSGVDSDDAVTVDVSGDGGASWTTLETFTGISGAASGSRSYDVSSHVSENTRVRFRVTHKYGGSNEHFFADGVEVTASCDAPPQTVESRISHSMDDAEERPSDGDMYTGSSDLELVEDGSKGQQLVGMRFRNVAVPAGAVITSAYVEFETDETNSGATSLTFRGEASSNAAAFVDQAYNLTNRTKTGASVGWSPPSWNTVSEKHQTPDLAAIVQEIVDRAGWASGNSLVIFVSGSGERTAESYDGEPANAPLLRVTYTTP